MSRRRGLLVISCALAVAGMGSAVPAGAQTAPFYGLVAQLGVSCLVQAPGGAYDVVATDTGVAACCAVITEVGPEQIDFLEAVALGDARDPRLLVLNDQLVDVLLSCRPEAVQRLDELAIIGPATPAAVPGP